MSTAQVDIEQTAEGDALRLRVDELYYEHHVLGSPMSYQWRESFENLRAQAHVERGAVRMLLPTLRESYTLFTRLREAGIRAHSWV